MFCGFLYKLKLIKIVKALIVKWKKNMHTMTHYNRDIESIQDGIN